ncbi:MAG: Ribonuclease Y [uncultured Solirubrobacterales bacterium]|uniref:Ribonuclease Y n=1 Tax=uncultured Solirubrobacterales bacterium TaxID=768556 RepID=A0A6J4T1I8_9ACTN|nr:MAG: Ribonuclease Y [uncultured Solirubrobacterales bacterium]
MEIVLVLLAVLAAGAAVTAVVTTHRARGLRTQSGALSADAGGDAGSASSSGVALTASPRAGDPFEDDAEASAGPSTADLREQLDLELVQRRAEVGRIEERLLGKEQSIDVRTADLERREQTLADRQRNLERSQEEIKGARRDQLRELERIAGLTAGQAKQLMLRELEDELEHDSARKIRQAEEEARQEADRRARSILATSMQRLAAGHAVETTVSVVQLRSDDLKGRIIGKEGRNIRSLETLTGIDFIVDDTPSTVVLSGFDGVRREIARITLEKLLEDGRIHPARIEDAYDQAVSEMESHIVEVGEQAVFDAEAGSLHPELIKLLGKLRYRTSYGQNVLAHSVECANLAGTLAAELGANPKTARRAALLHDIGKAVTHEIEGPHALVGGDIARRYGETGAVAHAMEAHHNEVELQTIEAVVVQVADSLSGARPGARGESLEHYVKRLRELEGIATRHPGVDKVFAMQAGREVRVIVSPEDVDDDAAALLSHAIARDVEKELEYPGQIKVTVIRESRAVDYAK